MLIIASFLLSLGGCGYKKSPYYLKSAPQSDENVEFIIKRESQSTINENNESCE